ncbi:protein HtrL [Biomphalaria glabrata]|uniref:Uncharacterized protein n=1 Tax=Biomphalaria glabrata TaxID=6526 RepID=A0A2C9LV45_BIOGL|nr:protein HtrL-like [Biomphalaria glabrata]
MKGSGLGRWTSRSRFCSVSLGLLLVVLLALVLSHQYNTYLDANKVQQIRDTWPGFEQEKGNYSFTVVTGLFDIGRGSWWTQTRSYNEYLSHLFQILKLDVNLIIFIEPKGKDFVAWARQGREQRTKIIVQEIKDLEYFPLLGRITEIMESEQFQNANENYKKGKCEAVFPLYNLVTNSKITLVHQAISRNPFSSHYFIWLDGGYGHGNSSLFPKDGVWVPRHLLSHPDQVSFVALRNLADKKTEEVHNLHKADIAWIAGGLFAGGTAAMEAFYAAHRSVLQDYMMEGKIDDDQTTFSDCYFRQPSNYRPVLGSWYDLLEPFT